jgi:general secretion pathway protein A
VYSDHYGLTDRPFQLTPDARFFFRGPTHSRAIDRIETAVSRGSGMSVVIGETGTGKTMLGGHLIEAMDSARHFVLRLRSGEVEQGAVLALIARDLGIETGTATTEEALDGITLALAEYARRGRQALFVMDDAQNLGVAALRELGLLFDRPGADAAPAHILLLGRPGLQESLQHGDLDPLRRHIIVAHRLTPIGPDEVEPYIYHRLTTVGWVGFPSFTAEALAAIHRFSGGLPRRINMVSSRLLLLGAIERLKVIDEEAVAVVVADFANDPTMPDVPAYQPPEPLQYGNIFSESPTSPSHLAVVPRMDDADLADRLAQLESRLEEQDEILRRVLSLLIDWAETGLDRAPAANIARDGVA